MNDSVNEFKKRILNLYETYQLLVESHNREFILNQNIYLNFYNAIKDYNSYNEIEKYLFSLKKNKITKEIYELIKKYKYYDKIRCELYCYAKKIDNKNDFKFIRKIFNEISFSGVDSFENYINNLKNNVNMLTISEKVVLHNILELVRKSNDNVKYCYYNTKLLDEIKNTDKSNIKIFNRKVNKLIKNRTLMLSNNNFRMNYHDVILCSSMDNRVVKDLQEGNELEEWEIVYLKALNDEMLKDPYLILSLPLSNLDESVLLKYSEYLKDISQIMDNSIKLYKEAKDINDSYVQGEYISDIESNKLFKFFKYYININRINSEFEYEDIISYLVNSKKILTYDEKIFLVKYLGYNKCIEDELWDSEIGIGNFSSVKGMSDICGVCSNGIIFINKDLINKNNNTDEVLVTLFHELRHVLQRNESNSKKSSQMSYDNAIVNIINYLEPRDYDINYYDSYSELDANKMAYNELIRFYLKYKKDNKKNIINAHKKSIDIYKKESFNIRKSHMTGSLVKQFTAVFEKEYTDRYFENNPDELDNYPLFKNLYLPNGKTRELDDFLSYYHNGSEQYYYNFFTALLYEGKKISKEQVNSKSLREKQNMIKNLDNLFDILIDRMFLALDILDEKYSNFKDKRVLKNNMLLDVKMGNRIIVMFDNILKISSDLRNEIDKLNIDIIDNFNDNKELFYKLEEEIKSRTSIFGMDKII